MWDAAFWLVDRLLGGYVDLFLFIVSPGLWLDFSEKTSLSRIIYYGASVELFFVIVDIAIALLVIGLWRRSILWAVVRGIEAVNNAIGRVAAWAALLMVVQQVLIVSLQRIFRVSEISAGPFGIVFTKDLSWFGEELKLYNAAIVTLCAAYTFIQGGHVRVDLFYASMRFRTRKLMDMFGSLFFVIPFMTVVWLFGWYFLWRHLLTPKVAATDSLELLVRKARLMRWNVETIGFSPNGFDAYFLFKVLLVSFAALMFLQGLAFFYRSLLEYLEGPASENRYRDFDATFEDPEVVPTTSAPDAPTPAA
ncbi:MAG: C4-dicarboxylate ABC transporter permease [Alphaproteobacteria bacterium]|nr:C4-dicarboxylate ABC transporter permease [Alphaproteobacteria bacterium]